MFVLDKAYPNLIVGIDALDRLQLTRSQVTGVKPQVKGLTKSSCGIETW